MHFYRSQVILHPEDALEVADGGKRTRMGKRGGAPQDRMAVLFPV